MLGAHVLGFNNGNQFLIRPGVPQGVELVFSDAFRRGSNLSLGGFIYPEISGKEYYNIWLRWGGSRYFVELNYILWKEQVDSSSVFSRSVGVSLGLPLARFL